MVVIDLLYTPGLCQLRRDLPLLVINSLPTAGTLLAAVKRRSLQVEYEAVVVVGVATVNSLHVSRRLLVVDGHGGVWREEPVPADLAVLRWVSLY